MRVRVREVYQGIVCEVEVVDGEDGDGEVVGFCGESLAQLGCQERLAFGDLVLVILARSNNIDRIGRGMGMGMGGLNERT